MSQTTPVAPSSTLGSTPVAQPATTASSTSTASRNSSRSLPEIIELTVEKGIRVVLTRNGYEIDGFYKGGPIRLEQDSASSPLVAIDRKEKKTVIKNFDDLVKLNYDWWKKSRDRGAEFINPGKEWIEEFTRLNFVKRQVIFIPGDD